MIRGVGPIARNTYKEAIRDRILYVFLVFAVMLIIGSRLISILTVGDEAKVMKDIGLFAIQFFGALIAIMMSVLMISREFDRRTVYTILSRPVNRGAYLLGKYFGLASITAVMLALMAVAMVVIILIFSSQFDLMLVFGAAMTLLEMMVLCAFAVFFATITKPILASVLTLTSFIFGHLTESLWLLKDRLQNPVADAVLPVLYYILPNLEVFNFKTEIVHGLALPWPAVFWALAYGIIYSAVLLTLAWVQFEGKDIQ